MHPPTRTLLTCLLLAAAPAGALAQSSKTPDLVDTAPSFKNYDVVGAPVVTLGSVTSPRVVHAYAFAPSGPGDMPAYLTLINHGPADALIGASCGRAQGTTLNEAHPKHPAHPGLAPMDSSHNPILERIALPAHSTVQLKPGADYLNLQDLAVAPQPGERIDCTLDFEVFGPEEVSLVVVKPHHDTDHD